MKTKILFHRDNARVLTCAGAIGSASTIFPDLDERLFPISKSDKMARWKKIGSNDEAIAKMKANFVGLK